MRDPHTEIVENILPRLAEKLKEEGIVSEYSREQEKIPFDKLPDVKIDPDLVLVLSNGKKILVEVANPGDPKRFIGELVYPKILIHYKRISATMIFVLYPQKEIHKRSLSENIALHESLGMPKGSRIVTWPGEDVAYNHLKAFVKSFA